MPAWELQFHFAQHIDGFSIEAQESPRDNKVIKTGIELAFEWFKKQKREMDSNQRSELANLILSKNKHLISKSSSLE